MITKLIRSCVVCCRALALITLLFIVGTARTTATEYVSEDGSWWQSLPDYAKVFVVEGMTSAYHAGFNEGQASVNGLITYDSGSRLSLKEGRHLLDAQAQPPTFTKFFSTYVNDLTAFYNDHPEAAKAPVGDVLACLADKPSISCEQVAIIFAKVNQ